MGRAKRFFDDSAENKRDCYVCRCGVRVPKEWWPHRGDPPVIVHCEGGVGWQKLSTTDAHHARVNYGKCWRCNLYLGCDQCLGPVTEVLCRRCAAWGTPESLADHGPVSNTEAALAKRHGVVAPQVPDYPPAFRSAYAEARNAEADAGLFEGAPATVQAVGAMVGTIAATLSTDPKERAALQLELAKFAGDANEDPPDLDW